MYSHIVQFQLILLTAPTSSTALKGERTHRIKQMLYYLLVKCNHSYNVQYQC